MGHEGFTNPGRRSKLLRSQQLGNWIDVRQDDAGQEVRAARGRHGISPGPDPAAHRADEQPHRSLPGARQGLSRTARPLEDGLTAPPAARVPEARRPGTVSAAYRRAGSPPLTPLASRSAPRKSTGAPRAFLCALDRQYGETRRTQLRGPRSEARGGPPGQTGRGLLPRAVRGDSRARRSDRVGQRLDPPVLPPDRRIPRESLRGGQDPRRLPEAGGPAPG